MKKSSLKKVLSPEYYSQKKKVLLEQIALNLQLIGANSMGMMATASDDVEFLTLYAKITSHKAQGYSDELFFKNNKEYLNQLNESVLTKV